MEMCYWICDDMPQFAAWLDKKKGGEEYSSGDYIASIRCGDLCVDLIESEDGLYGHLYVGGIDSGYGYSDDGYPYDECTEFNVEFLKEKIESSDMDSLMEEIGNSIREELLRCESLYKKCSLREKAEEELKVW